MMSATTAWRAAPGALSTPAVATFGGWQHHLLCPIAKLFWRIWCLCAGEQRHGGKDLSWRTIWIVYHAGRYSFTRQICFRCNRVGHDCLATLIGSGILRFFPSHWFLGGLALFQELVSVAWLLLRWWRSMDTSRVTTGVAGYSAWRLIHVWGV